MAEELRPRSDAKARMNPVALTAAEVGTLLGLHLNTVKRIPADRLPFFRVTHRGDRRYRMADVYRYQEAMTGAVGWWEDIRP